MPLETGSRAVACELCHNRAGLTTAARRQRQQQSGTLQNRVTIYIKTGCHLCAQMQDELAACQSQFNLAVTTVVIDGREELLAQYGHKVPVLVREGEEICHFFLDRQALEQALHGAAAGGQ